MVELTSIAPIFAVSDVGSTVRWYQEFLGFDADPFPKEEPYVFAVLNRDGIEIMLQRIPGYQKPDLSPLRAGGSWDAYIRMKGVAEFYELLKGKVAISMPLTRQPYGDTEFEVRDLNGYILVFSELVD